MILSVGLVFQQLEGMQTMEDELRDARNASKRLMQEKYQVSNALKTKRAKVISLSQEKSSVLEEKRRAL